MSEESPDPKNQKRSFEEKVFARFDGLDLNIRHMESSVRSMEVRVQKLGQRIDDAKPSAEQVLKEIIGTRRELSQRLDKIEAVVLETRAGLSDVEDRLDRIERKPVK
jgi:chromosome segregation ATPase